MSIRICSGIAAAISLWAAGTGEAGARNLSSVDFSLRLPAALAEFSSYNDVAGLGGASAGSKFQSSGNPAASDWETTTKYPLALSPQYSRITFGRGPTLDVVDESVTYKSDEWGSFIPAAVELRSSQSMEDNFTLMDGNYAQIQWGKKLDDSFAIGTNLNYTSLCLKAGAADVVFEHSCGQTYAARVGVLGKASDHLMLGLVGDVSETPSKTTSAFFSTVHDNTTEVLVRPGLNYEYAEKSSVYVDYQYGYYTNDTGSFNTSRVFAGVEQRLLPWLFGRGGFADDARGNFSPTLGIGIYPCDQVSIDIGFQSKMFPELQPEFGNSKVYGISAAVQF